MIKRVSDKGALVLHIGLFCPVFAIMPHEPRAAPDGGSGRVPQYTDVSRNVSLVWPRPDVARAGGLSGCTGAMVSRCPAPAAWRVAGASPGEASGR